MKLWVAPEKRPSVIDDCVTFFALLGVRARRCWSLLVVAVAVVLPFMPFAATLGFVPPPAAFFGFLGAATASIWFSWRQ